MLDKNTLHDYIKESVYLFEYQHTSSEQNEAALYITSLIIELSKRYRQFGTEFEKYFPLYTTYVFNEYEEYGKRLQFYREEQYSGHHHRIMLIMVPYTQFVSAYNRQPVSVNDVKRGVEAIYDDNDDLYIGINPNYLLSFERTEHMNKSDFAHSYSSLYSRISHELQHLMDFCNEKKKKPVLIKKTELYTDFINHPGLNIKDSVILKLKDFVYLLSPHEMRARLKETESVLSTSVKSDYFIRNVYEQLENLMKDDNGFYRDINRNLLLSAILRTQQIANATRLKQFYNFIQSFEKLQTQNYVYYLIAIGYYIHAHKLTVVYNEHYKEILSSTFATRYFNEFDGVYNGDEKLLSVANSILESIKKLFVEFEWKVANTVDRYLNKIFKSDENIPDSELIHTILSRELKLSNERIKNILEGRKIFNNRISPISINEARQYLYCNNFDVDDFRYKQSHTLNEIDEIAVQKYKSFDFNYLNKIIAHK